MKSGDLGEAIGGRGLYGNLKNKFNEWFRSQCAQNVIRRSKFSSPPNHAIYYQAVLRMNDG
jgi:hypothetical protein